MRVRDGKGVFGGLDDLKAVPGLDAAMIDAVKDRPDFTPMPPPAN